MKSAMTAIFLLAASLSLALPAPEKPELFRNPALSRTHIVFHYAGDLWMVGRDGGEARRLTTNPGQEANPHFSPDGQWIAFSGEYDGNIDAYVIPAAGGVPRRLTWHPAADIVAGWTRDGRRILFRSNRQSYSRFNNLFTLDVNGVFPEELPLHMAEEGSFSPDGSRIAYVPIARAFNSWKRYRGGRTTGISLARLSDSSVEKIPRENSNDFNPMWIDHRIYFLSDREGPATLFSYDTNAHRLTRVLPVGAFDIKNAAADSDAIAYEQFGGIHLFDLKSGKTRKVPITLKGDMPEVRPRLEKLAGRINAAAISPTGARALFEARGEILTVPADKGDCRNLTNTPGSAERDPSWSPDGKWIAYFSDASGEYELHLRDQTSRGDVRTFRLSDPPTFYYTPVWSPDSSKIAFTDKSLNLGYLDVATGRTAVVDTDRFDGPRRISHIAWSPDSQWLTYTKQLQNTLRAAFVYSLESKAAHQVTDGMSDVTSPVFDRDGKHMYFLASTNTGLNLGWRDMSAYFRPLSSSVYVVVLRKDLPSPILPESDEEKPAEQQEKAKASGDETKGKKTEKAAPVSIDVNGIAQRTLALPIPARNYTKIVPGKER